MPWKPTLLPPTLERETDRIGDTGSEIPACQSGLFGPDRTHTAMNVDAGLAEVAGVVHGRGQRRSVAVVVMSLLCSIVGADSEIDTRHFARQLHTG